MYIYRCMYIYILLQAGFHWDCDNWHVTRMIKRIYNIARMSQGSIKKRGTMGREFLYLNTLGKL